MGGCACTQGSRGRGTSSGSVPVGEVGDHGRGGGPPRRLAGRLAPWMRPLQFEELIVVSG